MDQKNYKGNREIIMPEEILEALKTNSITRNLHITKAGYYPKSTIFHNASEEGNNENLLIYCVDGMGKIIVQEKIHELKAQQFYIISKNTPFLYEPHPSNPWSVYWVYFTGLDEEVFSSMYNKLNEIKKDSINRIEGRILIFDEIFRNLENGYSNENLEYANISLWYLLASFRYIQQFREIRRVRSIDIIQQAILYMKENIEQRINLQDIASEIGLSPSHFSLLFSKKMNSTPIDYLNKLKVQQACLYLKSNTIKIRELSEKLGFYDQFHFSKTFKKYMLTTPSEYRRIIKKSGQNEKQQQAM